MERLLPDDLCRRVEEWASPAWMRCAKCARPVVIFMGNAHTLVSIDEGYSMIHGTTLCSGCKRR